MSAVKRKLNCLSLLDKVKLISEVDKGEKKKKCIAEEFGIPRSTLSTILKNREHILKEVASGMYDERKRLKKCTYEDIDIAVLNWLKSIRGQNLRITGSLIREKALAFAQILGHDNFGGSIGWLDKFKGRHKIVQKIICGKDDGLLENEDWWRVKLPELLADYSQENIFNAMEIGIFYKCLPEQTLMYRNQECVDSSKERVTILACTNMTGTEKLDLLIIGRSKTPLTFTENNFLSVIYRDNEDAWITSQIFEEWISYLDEKISNENRKILLFVDTCPTHLKVVTKVLKSIKIVFFPPNTTSLLQPLNQGVITNLKQHYRKRILKKALTAIEIGEIFDITLLEAITTMTNAWKFDVESSIIRNSFIKADFLKECPSNIELSMWELQFLFDCYLKKVPSDLTLDDFISFDDHLIVAKDSLDLKIEHADDLELDEQEETLAIPTNKEMYTILRKCRQYLYSKSDVTNGVIGALDRLENFVQNEIFATQE